MSNPAITTTLLSVMQKAKIAYTSWFGALNDFPKTSRYNLGTKIDGYFLELLEYVFISLYLPPDQKIARLTTVVSNVALSN
jgi:hypothetical protein